jgi:DNA mismatch repair protein MutL
MYKLKSPLTIHLSIEDVTILDANKEVLKKCGYSFKISDKKIVITEVPLLFKDRNIEEIVRSLIVDIAEEKNIGKLDTRTQRMLAYLACRAAVKAGDILTQVQCKDLIKQLNQTKNPYSCPHGRPTKIEIPGKDIAKLFKRI